MFIFDIDGTIADCSHRLHYIQQKPKDWPAFFAACDKDTPIEPTISILGLLSDACSAIVLVTGRSDECRGATEHWLKKYCNVYDQMYMRKAGDHRDDVVVKSEILDEILKWRPLKSIEGVFEDRASVVQMYRKRGLRVYQVADGNF